jgi:hypothetical protein
VLSGMTCSGAILVVINSELDVASSSFAHPRSRWQCRQLCVEVLDPVSNLSFPRLRQHPHRGFRRFPELCSSLSLHNISPPTEFVSPPSPSPLAPDPSTRLKWVFSAYDEIMQAFGYASDLEAFEHACGEALRFLVGPVSGAKRRSESV